MKPLVFLLLVLVFCFGVNANSKSTSGAKGDSNRNSGTKAVTSNAVVSRKLNVDLSQVPSLGSQPSHSQAGTEAGTNAPGAGSSIQASGGSAGFYYQAPTETLNRRGMPNRLYPASSSRVPGTYLPSDFFGRKRNNSGIAGMEGVVGLFAQVQSLVTKVAPQVGNQPLFKGECFLCFGRKKNKNLDTEDSNSANSYAEVANSWDNSFAGGDGDFGSNSNSNANSNEEVASGESSLRTDPNTSDGSSGRITTSGLSEEELLQIHNPELILAMIEEEKSILKPFASLPDGTQVQNVQQVISTLGYFQNVMVSNSGEYSKICPNFDKLNYNQKQAFLVFLFSEIFKATSNFNNQLRKEVRVNGIKSNRIGMCQLEYSEVVTAIQQNGGDTTSYLESEFEQDAKDPKVNIYLCTLLIAQKTQNASSDQVPVRKMFPNVNFEPITQRLKQLSLCRQTLTS